MAHDTHLAFEHPLARSEATGPAVPLDRISLRDHIVAVEIGAFQAERGTTQRISFNIVVEVAPQNIEVDDDVDRILSYDKVTEAIDFELSAERLNLLETLAQRIADRILLEPQAVRVFVRIEKLDRGSGNLGVEIVRNKQDASDESAAQSGACEQNPRVVFLSMEAVASEHLPVWLDQLSAMPEPVILCVASPGEPAPKSLHVATQRRIDLLALEQSAWVLAGRDPRCVVVGTRTELDWAMKNDQVSVWAPSKIVLDSVDSPVDLGQDSAELSAWFAQDIGACEFVVIGADAHIAQPATPIRQVCVDQRKL
jgi:dihydroneopterin aldolase